MSGADLQTVQARMHEALVRPRGAGGMAGLLAASPRLSGADGLAIYQRGYFLRIASCMREQFPALCHALGPALFDDFVADYIFDRPPESHTLYDLGRRFPAWLAGGRPDAERPPQARESWIDFMIDLAGFERQIFAMFDAPGHEGRPFADTDTPDEALRLQPCFDLGAFGFPVAEYYHDVRRDGQAALPVARASYVALVRSDFVTRTVPLSEVDFLFLATMRAGGSLDDGLEAVAHHLALPREEVRLSWRSAPAGRRRWIDLHFFVADESFATGRMRGAERSD